MGGILRRCTILAGPLLFFGSAHMIGTPPSRASAHWYVIAPFEFYQEQADAEPWKRKIQKKLMEDNQRCEVGAKTYNDLFKAEGDDPNMEIIRIKRDLDALKKVRLVISVSSGPEGAKVLNDAGRNCGTPNAEDCVEASWQYLANIVIQHDRQCHRGNTCGD